MTTGAGEGGGEMTEALALSVDFAAVTDIGCKRTNNEDSYGYDIEQRIYVVCDGTCGKTFLR